MTKAEDASGLYGKRLRMRVVYMIYAGVCDTRWAMKVATDSLRIKEKGRRRKRKRTQHPLNSVRPGKTVASRREGEDWTTPFDSTTWQGEGKKENNDGWVLNIDGYSISQVSRTSGSTYRLWPKTSLHPIPHTHAPPLRNGLYFIIEIPNILDFHPTSHILNP